VARRSGRDCRTTIMKKVPLYSRSKRAAEAPPEAGLPVIAPASPAASPASRRSRFIGALARHERRVWALAFVALAAAFWWFNANLAPKTPLTMEQIDSAMRQSIEDKPLVSPASRAYDTIFPSVVRIVGLMTDGDDGSDDKDHGMVERGVGSGVVIIDNGTILTNLHVINGAKKIKVTFYDGSESEAVVLNTQPENDLAVLRARTIPDDLEAATMRSTSDLSPGDEVIAVGFPFGIGPSVSSGIVSGLKRQFRSPDGQQMLSNLIQFDAAANPGNSGGPLVTTDGAVVGIVTAILNPSHQRVFIGIGFAVPIENAAAAAGMPPLSKRRPSAGQLPSRARIPSGDRRAYSRGEGLQ
jgi:S1-C subfamily serine protease